MGNVCVICATVFTALALFGNVCGLRILSLYWFEFSSDKFLCQVAIGVGPVCQSGDAFKEPFQDGDCGVNGCPVFAEDFECSLGSGTVSGNKSGFSCFEWFHLYWFACCLLSVPC